MDAKFISFSYPYSYSISYSYSFLINEHSKDKYE